jgi:hypothetical protein
MSAPSAARTTFSTSRLLEFASVRELVAQTGTSPDDWPLMLVRELIDNALDAAEEGRRAIGLYVSADRGGGVASVICRGSVVLLFWISDPVHRNPPQGARHQTKHKASLLMTFSSLLTPSPMRGRPKESFHGGRGVLLYWVHFLHPLLTLLLEATRACRGCNRRASSRRHGAASGSLR